MAQRAKQFCAIHKIFFINFAFSPQIGKCNFKNNFGTFFINPIFFNKHFIGLLKHINVYLGYGPKTSAEGKYVFLIKNSCRKNIMPIGTKHYSIGHSVFNQLKAHQTIVNLFKTWARKVNGVYLNFVLINMVVQITKQFSWLVIFIVSTIN